MTDFRPVVPAAAAALRRMGFIARNLYVSEWPEFAGDGSELSSDNGETEGTIVQAVRGRLGDNDDDAWPEDPANLLQIDEG